jgi:hypothetical protein
MVNIFELTSCFCYPTVEHSLLPLGYARNEDVRGYEINYDHDVFFCLASVRSLTISICSEFLPSAPYDFRKAPNEMHAWMQDFKKLVEHSYVTNSNLSVVLLAHSMGSPLSLYFLNQMTQTWKDKHIRVGFHFPHHIPDCLLPMFNVFPGLVWNCGTFLHKHLFVMSANCNVTLRSIFFLIVLDYAWWSLGRNCESSQSFCRRLVAFSYHVIAFPFM